MFKKCLYFFLSVLFLQNACFADTEALKRVNQEYMALMLGAEGILHQKATPEQINQMIDGCITAGIVDRLHNFPSKEAEFREQVRKFDGYKKLDVELAYAFYKLGYDKSWNEGNTDQNLADINQNFDTGKFHELSAHVYNKGSIVEYRNRLEDVIRRTSKPLRFDDFVEIENRPPSGTVTPVTTRSFKSMGSSLRVKEDVSESDAYKTFIRFGIPHEEAMRMLGQVVDEYTELEESIPPASLTSLAFSAGEEKAERIERYYTPTEIKALSPEIAVRYETMRNQGKTAKAISMVLRIEKKYEGE
jgi:hypothetical protein